MYYYRRMPKFDYLAPKSIDEVSSLLQQHKGEARIMAGGTIVLHRMKERIAVRPCVIGIQAVAGLDSITYDGKTGLRIGAMARLQAIAESADVKKGCALLSTVCGQLGTPQIRNMGTIGGNVASRFATAETVPALIALGAETKVLTATGEKVVAVEDLYKELKDGDLITEICIPALAAKTTTGYKKFAVRERFDYATVAAAVIMIMDGKTCKDIKIGLGGVTLQTMRAKAAEEVLKGQVLTDALIEKAAGVATDSGNVGSDVMFSADYKKKVLKTMVKRALKEAVGEVLK
jgi:aerobic carbon-monoxide dehydrogenase medium subunit